MQYRLGIDLGTNSIGWAAVQLDESGNARGVLDMGVRIFPDGRENSQSIDPLGQSLAVNRRIPRGQRRRRDRYLKRRSELLDALTACGLMPPDAEARAEIAALDPYPLRKSALEQRLSPYDLGRALFHLNQRRGFKSNRKAKPKDDEKESREDLSNLRIALREKGMTLGEYLAELHAEGKPVRARPGLDLYPDRAMYEAEFDAIRKAQERHHDLRPDQWDTLRDIVFYQRPLRPVDPGWCLLEEGERRAPRAMPSAQEFRVLQEVNNLRIRVGVEPERPLNDGERARVLQRLREGKDIDLQKPLKGLRLDGSFNLSRGGRKKLQGDQTTARLAKPELFGKRWLDLSLEERDAIAKRLLDTEDPEDVRQAAVSEWGLSNAQAENVAEVGLPDGHVHLSLKAIGEVLPHLRDGMRYDEAVAAGYPHHSDFRNAEAHDRLPYYGAVLERDVVGADPRAPGSDEVKRYGRFPNPTVHVGLNQLRRVVNRLIDVYGKPAEIVVELARALKSTKEQREEYVRRQRWNEEENKNRRELLQGMGVEPRPPAMLRLRIWEEQGPPQKRLCPYTGKPISCRMALSEQTEIDHILPRSKTLDDSIANKVLCIRDSNRLKLDRSPYDAFHGNPDGYDYDAILACAENLPDNKKWRFLPDAMDRFADERGFLERQLNETRYLSRTARSYLAHLYNEKTQGRQFVRVVPGRMTALLRRGWELEGMLREGGAGKQRDDHRHHAVDAFVVANTTQGLVQQFQQAAGQGTEEHLAKLAPKPWDGFSRREVKPFIDRMTVSHKPDHGTPGTGGKTTGKLHLATAYGLREDPKPGGGAMKVVIRMDLAHVKRRADLAAVRDPGLRDALLSMWDAAEADKPELDRAEEELARREERRPRKQSVGALFAQRAWTDGVNVNGRVQHVRRVRVVDKLSVVPITDAQGRAYKGYVRGSNAFADIWRMRDGSWQTIVVPTFEFNQKKFSIEQFRPKSKDGRPDPAAKRLMRLHIDDMGALGEGQDCRIVRVRKIANSQRGARIVLDAHNEANVASRAKDPSDPVKEIEYRTGQLQRQGFRLIAVDEIGRVRDPGPRSA